MRDTLRFSLTLLRTHRTMIIALVISAALVLPSLYVVGLINQPELISYVEDGLFYGHYIYDLSTVRLVGGIVALSLVLLFTGGSFGGFLSKSSGTLMLTLPASRGAKFAAVAVAAFAFMPLIIGVLWVTNDWIWSASLGVDPLISMVGDNPYVFYALMFMALNAVFFYFGVRFRRYQWAYCLAFLLIVGAGVYCASSLTAYAPDPISYTDGLFTLTYIIFTVGLIALSALRFFRIEVRG